MHGCGHCNKARRDRNQPNKAMLVQLKPLVSLRGCFYRLYTSNKTERFSYKGGCGVRILLYMLHNYIIVVSLHYTITYTVPGF